MRRIPWTLILRVGASVGIAACSGHDGFSGIAVTGEDSPGVIGPDDPSDWQPRCEGAVTEVCFYPAYPNPTTSATRLAFSLPDSGSVEVYVEIAPGRRARMIGTFPVVAGQHVVVWDGRDNSGDDLPTGIYRVWLKVTDAVDGTRHTTFGDVEIVHR